MIRINGKNASLEGRALEPDDKKAGEMGEMTAKNCRGDEDDFIEARTAML